LAQFVYHLTAASYQRLKGCVAPFESPFLGCPLFIDSSHGTRYRPASPSREGPRPPAEDKARWPGDTTAHTEGEVPEWTPERSREFGAKSEDHFGSVQQDAVGENTGAAVQLGVLEMQVIGRAIDTGSKLALKLWGACVVWV